MILESAHANAWRAFSSRMMQRTRTQTLSLLTDRTHLEV